MRWLPSLRPVRAGLPANAPYEVSFLISSGTLVPCSALLALRGMRSNYFIDHVDTEWCLRARAAGYLLLVVPEARLYHRLGDSVRRIWFLVHAIFFTIPQCQTIMFRNTLLMLRSTAFGAMEIPFAASIRSVSAYISWSWEMRVRHACVS